MRTGIAIGAAVMAAGMAFAPTEMWVEIGTGSASGGGISDNADPSLKPSLSLDAGGSPVVA